MLIRILSGVVTSQGVKAGGTVMHLPASEATALINMGRAELASEDAPAPQHRDEMPVVKRGRKKAGE